MIALVGRIFVPDRILEKAAVAVRDGRIDSIRKAPPCGAMQINARCVRNHAAQELVRISDL